MDRRAGCSAGPTMSAPISQSDWVTSWFQGALFDLDAEGIGDRFVQCA